MLKLILTWSEAVVPFHEIDFLLKIMEMLSSEAPELTSKKRSLHLHSANEIVSWA